MKSSVINNNLRILLVSIHDVTDVPTNTLHFAVAIVIKITE
jgi:hypothetical protein